MPNTIFLTGARASGKSTVGRKLAEMLNFRFVDTDHYLLEASHMTVAEIVASEGWDGFRRRESEALRRVTEPHTVVATGGGIVLSADNRSYMRSHGTVFYLAVPVAVLAGRLEADPNAEQRPTLTGKTIVEEVGEVLGVREPLYRESAHYQLDGSLPVEAVLAQALRLLDADTASSR